MDKNQPMTYKAAKADLEKIINSMKQDNPDIDRLVANIKRANELLDFCRAKLKSETDKIETIV
jgi:exodeoxyribonuclease VII small subunit